MTEMTVILGCAEQQFSSCSVLRVGVKNGSFVVPGVLFFSIRSVYYVLCFKEDLSCIVKQASRFHSHSFKKNEN